MKLSIVATLLFTALYAQAEVTTKIAGIVPPDEITPNYEVLAYRDGRVYQVSPDNIEVLDTLRDALKYKSAVELKLEERPYFADRDFPEFVKEASLSILSKGVVAKSRARYAERSSNEDYAPDEVATMEEAQVMFEGLYERTRWWTECYNRAHIWNRQIHKDHGVKNEKVFIFYTRKFRREYPSWKWWFHAAPLVRVGRQPVVLDKEFMGEAKTLEQWESRFNSPYQDDENQCIRIGKMSEYYEPYNAKNEYCNILVAPMYYWEPSELSEREEGVYKTQWVNWELRQAVNDVFGPWSNVYEEYKL